jgi:acetoacetate decarboxylase
MLEILEGRYTVDDFTLGYGDVIHDYLTGSEK